MNSTNVVAPTIALQSRGRADQATLLIRLEEKYGNKHVRLDSAHRSPPKPKTRATQFSNYVHWLTQHVDETGDPGHAAPDILATENPTILADGTRKNICAGGPTKDRSIEIDNSGFTLQQLARVDAAHVHGSSQKSAQFQTGSDFVPQPNFLGKTPRTENGPGIATSKVPAKTLAETVQTSIAATRKPASLLPTSVVAWEVDDFKWPVMIGSVDCTQTQSAGSMADAAVRILSTANQRLAVVGSGRGPGTTTIAMYLAKVLASRTKNVLLVDADLSKPDLTQRLGLPGRMSWMNVINDNRKCSETIIRSMRTGICVMPVSKLVTRVTWPDHIFDCLGGILEIVRGHFDFVIIDVGPASQVLRELSRPNILVDAAMLVHNVRAPDLPTYVRNQDELKSFGIKKLVVAENFSKRKSA